MSSRGLDRRSVNAAVVHSCSLPIASNETSLYIPFSGSRWNVASMRPRNMSRSSGGTPSSAAIT